MTNATSNFKSKSERDTVYVFTRFGLGNAPEDLQCTLVEKFLSLTIQSCDYPAKILFYTDGVKLACQGSPVLAQLNQLEAAGVELVLCSTCLEYFKLTEKVAVGIIGGMTDILEAIQKAPRMISL
jgi:intracellular sulfur oxidation DsrE/DsrF family protein